MHSHSCQRSLLYRLGLLSVFALLILAGCSTARQVKSHQAETAMPRAGGYTPDHSHTTTSLRETWTLGEDQIDVTLLLPSGSGEFPLVLYLPGLGEASDAGAAWRLTWAQAGYAVLSAQPTALGPALWTSEQARIGDFRGVAKESFSARRLAVRVAAVRGVMDELSRRKGMGDYARIDLTRCAVIGFDLGAQTAMVVAGQHIDGVEVAPFPATVKGIVALSPYADFTGMSAEPLFRSIRLPVLSITALEDVDQYGLVTSASVRRAPFQRMPPGNKYLLVLSGATHTHLSGNDTPPREESAGTPARSEQPSQEGRGGRRSGSGGGRKSHGGEQGGTRYQPPLGVSTSAIWSEQARNVQGMTTAYLDAVVKNDPVAWEWLKKDAQRWLGDSAQLMVK